MTRGTSERKAGKRLGSYYTVPVNGVLVLALLRRELDLLSKVVERLVAKPVKIVPDALF